VIGVALATFAWAANPPDEAKVRVAPVLLRTGTPVELILSDAGKTRLKAALGEKCVVQPAITAIAIEDLGGRTYSIAFPHSDRCNATLETLSPSDGMVVLPEE
jgi:hypothetical protein